MKVREAYGLNQPIVDLAKFVECELSNSGYVYDIVSGDEMGDDEAQAFPDSCVLRIREDIYEALIRQDRRARFTIAHEIGHLALHQGIPLRWAGTPQNNASRTHAFYEDSEWQADTFAAEFLMPVDLIRKYCTKAVEISDVFGVSLDAALIRISALRAERLLPW
jgi:Zn-dependent peptidase ImmA (M78 family)